jgi:DNA-binding response OmpR family regulator
MPKSILIYDDDVDILEICSIIIRMKGFEVICKSNCNDVLADIAECNPSAILMDNWLPDIGGVKAIQIIKQSEYKNIPVIFFTANTEASELAKKAGADYLLKKPFDVAELENMVMTASGS